MLATPLHCSACFLEQCPTSLLFGGLFIGWEAVLHVIILLALLVNKSGIADFITPSS
jgi:hypothetical protein